MLDTQSSYSKLAASGAIEPDTAQQRVAARLDLLLQQLGKKQASGISALGRLVGKKPASPPKGLYIWGEVGRGKTLLMDLFFDAAPVEDKRRVHFHAFMVEVHGRLHEARGNGSGDAITAVAEALAKEARLLCMDEFQVTDIADAMILSRLFGALFERGVVLVATSNQPPERLYYKGLNRELFLPFLALLEQRVDVVKLESRTDFRLEKLSSVPVWHVPADDEAKSALDETFLKLTGAREGRPESLRVQGRDVRVPDALDGVARFSFDDLCATARGRRGFRGDRRALPYGLHRRHPGARPSCPRRRPPLRHPDRRALRQPGQAGRIGRGGAGGFADRAGGRRRTSSAPPRGSSKCARMTGWPCRMAVPPT